MAGYSVTDRVRQAKGDQPCWLCLYLPVLIGSLMSVVTTNKITKTLTTSSGPSSRYLTSLIIFYIYYDSQPNILIYTSKWQPWPYKRKQRWTSRHFTETRRLNMRPHHGSKIPIIESKTKTLSQVSNLTANIHSNPPPPQRTCWLYFKHSYTLTFYIIYYIGNGDRNKVQYYRWYSVCTSYLLGNLWVHVPRSMQ